MPSSKSWRAVQLLLIIVLTVVVLYYGSGFLIPPAFGALLATIFHPMAKRLEQKGWPKGATITLSVFIFLLLFTALSGVIFMQGQSLVEDWPKISERLNEKQQQVEKFLIQQVGIAAEKRIDQAMERLSQQKKEIASAASGFIGSFFSFITGLVLALVYMVFFMLERRRIVNFFLKAVPQRHQSEARQAIHQARETATEYLVGRLILVGILSVLYIGGFLLSGLQYAVPIAILAAVLSIIPYIGNIIGGIIAIGIAFATGGQLSLILGVVGTMALAQVMESYVLTPWIMGKEVNLNPLATFACVLGFGVLWGIAGTVLAVPITGAAKKIFDHVDGLRPYGYLLGNRGAES